MRGREDEARSSFRTIAILMAIPVAGLAIFVLWRMVRGISEPAPPPEGALEARTTPAVAAPERPLPKVKPRAKTSRGRIVLIIDDLGFEGQPLGAVMSLDPNVNCSILPNGTRAAKTANELNARGYEILCHLPMEPQGREAPGRNAILTSMSDEDIARITRENIDAVPHARGVNNHMGSRATTDRRVMEGVLRALPDGMYFIDSRTTGGSIAASVAREMNVRTATRHIFLDDVATESSVRKQLASLAKAAQDNGVAVGIGHPHAVTMRVLAEELPGLKARGFRLVRASEIVR
jgi:polysaccharide deacetylase 2 family uncharacterized protein YibQ